MDVESWMVDTSGSLARAWLRIEAGKPDAQHCTFSSIVSAVIRVRALLGHAKQVSAPAHNIPQAALYAVPADLCSISKYHPLELEVPQN